MNRNTRFVRGTASSHSSATRTWFAVESLRGDAQRRRPHALLEVAGQDVAERVLLVEEADAADAEGAVAQRREAGDDVVDAVEDVGGRRDGQGAVELQGEEARVRAGGQRRRQEAVEERQMGRQRERARRLALLPTPSAASGPRASASDRTRTRTRATSKRRQSRVRNSTSARPTTSCMSTGYAPGAGKEYLVGCGRGRQGALRDR